MVDVAGRRGYEEATVARVAARAGAGRATFYEHFSGKDDCFAAAYRREAVRVREAIQAAAKESSADERPDAVLDVLFDAVVADPAAARLVLIEAFAAPAAVRAEHERLIAEATRLVALFLENQTGAAAIQIPAAALLAGVGEAVATRALTGERDLTLLRTGLASWINAYRLPRGARPFPQRRWRDLGRFARPVEPLSPEEPPLLPRGRSALPPARVAGARRQRLLDATAHLVAADGYAGLTVARIAAAARVPRAAFYSHFAGKREAFLAAQTAGMQWAMGAAASEFCPDAPWPERVWRAGEAFLERVGASPDYARLDFLEVHAAGTDAILRRHRNHLAFTLFLEDGYRQGPRGAGLPHVVSEAIAGAVFGLMRVLVWAGRSERMLSLLPAAAYTVTAPFIGPREAAAWVRKRAGGVY